MIQVHTSVSSFHCVGQHLAQEHAIDGNPHTLQKVNHIKNHVNHHPPPIAKLKTTTHFPCPTWHVRNSAFTTTEIPPLAHFALVSEPSEQAQRCPNIKFPLHRVWKRSSAYSVLPRATRFRYQVFFFNEWVFRGHGVKGGTQDMFTTAHYRHRRKKDRATG